MKKNYENHMGDLLTINKKCDMIIELLEAVLDNPDFLIDRLRSSVEHQHRSNTERHPRMRVIRYDGPR